MIQLPDEPMIARTLRTGYPHEPKAACTCSMCNEPIYEGESALHISGYGWICENCVADYMEVV